MVLTLGFIVVLFIGSKWLPGRQIAQVDQDGNQRSCRLNGLALFLSAMLGVALLQYLGWFTLAFLYENFLALLLLANVIAFAWSAWLYWRGSRDRNAPTGFWRGFFFGRELNPTSFGVDLKLFSYRPSLIALALFNISFAVVQIDIYGQLSVAMVLYQLFTFAYIFNYFQFEYGMIHTWDIVSERFGWMLVWGNLVLVPFFYSITGWALVHTQVTLPSYVVAGLVALYAFGFWLFRGANEQKHRFKLNPAIKIWGRPAETLNGRLLVSGFWGIGRHLNYTGEICVYTAFILTAGFNAWFPFLLLAWLIGLLVHRSRRDERRCREKYGELWTQYTKRVRFAMIPYVY